MEKGKIKQEIKDRLSNATISGLWLKVRNVAGTISVLALTASQIPLNLSENTNNWLLWIAGAAGIIAGGAHMDKSGKVEIKD